jgi:hypothetical protein
MESNEIGFAVFGFLYNFLQILQDQPTTIHYLRNQLLSRPLERLKLKYFCPWEARRRGRPELARAGRSIPRRGPAAQLLGSRWSSTPAKGVALAVQQMG